jgi:hypothetical protein
MLPSKKDNIYPRKKANILAFINYYFDIKHGDLQWLYDLKEIELNQIEFIAKKVSENQDYLDSEFKIRGNTVSNYMKYGVDALFYGLDQFKKENERKRITKELRDLMLKDN